MPLIKIFRSGKGTQTKTSFEGGVVRLKFTRVGQGHFLETGFATVTEAENFCQEELKKNRADIFYLLDDDLLVGTILDKKLHEDKRKRSQAIFSALSLIFFSFVGLWMSLALFPNHTVLGHLALTFSIGTLYACLHSFMGRGNFEGAVVMTILLVLFGVGTSAIHKVQSRNQPLNQTVNSVKSK